MPDRPLRSAVFLDRDGTLIADRHYLADPAGVELLPGAGRAVARLNAAGVPVLLVTNQSGIGRGIFTEDDFHAVQQRVREVLAEHGAYLDGEYHCPHGPDHHSPCDCRKPAPGLFLRAAAEHDADLATSFFIGDRLRDVTPALAFGGTGILVTLGAKGDDREPPPEGIAVVRTLEEAVDRVLAGLG